MCMEGVGTGGILTQLAAHAHRNWMEVSFLSEVQVERGPVSMIL